MNQRYLYALHRPDLDPAIGCDGVIDSAGFLHQVDDDLVRNSDNLVLLDFVVGIIATALSGNTANVLFRRFTFSAEGA